MVQSRFALQQAALKSAQLAELSPAQPAKARPKATPAPVPRPRGRPKTRLSTIDEIADYLYVSRSTIYRLIDSQQLPCLRVGHVLRFDLPAVLRWAQSAEGD